MYHLLFDIMHVKSFKQGASCAIIILFDDLVLRVNKL